MSEQLIREAVEKALAGALWANWPFWCSIAGVIILQWALASFLTPYITARATRRASKDDIEKIITEVKRTTAASEEIKAAIGHGAWSRKEYVQTRRAKLEDFAISIERALVDLDDMGVLALSPTSNRLLPDGRVPGLTMAGALCRLYFPEVHPAFEEFSQKYMRHVRLFDKARQELSHPDGENPLYQGAIKTELFDQSVDAHSELQGAKRALSAATAKLMAEIIEPTDLS